MIQTTLWNRLRLFVVHSHVLSEGVTFLGSVGTTEPTLPEVGGNAASGCHLDEHHYCIALHRVLTIWPMVQKLSFDQRMPGMGRLHSCCDRASVGLAAVLERPLACHGNRVHGTVNCTECRHGCCLPLKSQGIFLYQRASWRLPVLN